MVLEFLENTDLENHQEMREPLWRSKIPVESSSIRLEQKIQGG